MRADLNIHTHLCSGISILPWPFQSYYLLSAKKSPVSGSGLLSAHPKSLCRHKRPSFLTLVLAYCAKKSRYRTLPWTFSKYKYTYRVHFIEDRGCLIFSIIVTLLLNKLDVELGRCGNQWLRVAFVNLLVPHVFLHNLEISTCSTGPSIL